MPKRKLIGEVVFNSAEELNNSNLSELLTEFSGKRDVDAEIEITSAFIESRHDVTIALSTLLYDLCFKVRSKRKYRYERAVSVSVEDKLLFHKEDCIDSKRKFLIIRFYNAVKSKQTDKLPVIVIADENHVNRESLANVVITASCCNYVSDVELTNQRDIPYNVTIIAGILLTIVFFTKLFS